MKKRKQALWLIAMLTLLVTAAANLPLVAHAAPFDVGTEGGYALPGGVASGDVITQALNARIVEINGQIEALGSDPAALQAAYNSGELAAYSIYSGGAAPKIDSNNRRSGFKTWDGKPVADLKFLNAGYSGWGDNYVGWLQYNAADNRAYVVSGRIASLLTGSNKMGVAKGDAFKAGSYWYQNFTNGYARAHESTGNPTFTYRKNVGTDGTELAQAPGGNDAGYVGAMNDSFTPPAGMTRMDVYNVFAAAYDALGTEYVGYPWSVGDMWLEGKTLPFYKQDFMNSTSVANPWSDNHRSGWTIFAWNPLFKKAYTLRDEVVCYYVLLHNNSSSSNDGRRADVQYIGAPIGEMFEANGNRYQNFDMGYIKVNETTPTNRTSLSQLTSRVSVVKDKNINPAGEEVSVDTTPWVGLLDGSIEQTAAHLGEDVTLEQLSAMISAKFDEIKGDYTRIVPLAYASRVNNVIRQVFSATDSNNMTHTLALAYDRQNKVVRFMSEASYTTLINNTSLGHPVTDIFLAAEGSGDNLPAVYVQGFLNGYVRIVSTLQYDLIDGEFVSFYIDKGFSNIGAEYNADFNYFSPINYVDSVGQLGGSGNSLPSRAVTALAPANFPIPIPTGEDLTQKFKEGYQAAWDMGFSSGQPDSENITWWTTGENGVLKQSLSGGNGNGDIFGQHTMLAYDVAGGVVRVITGGIATAYASLGASGNGWPISDMMIDTVSGDIVQNFHSWDSTVQHRYVYFVVPAGNTTATQKLNGTFDFEQANNDGANYVPYLSQFSLDTITLSGLADTQYLAGSLITVDLKELISNPSGYTYKFDTASVSKGQLTEDGIWTYQTGTEAETIDLKVDIYTVFEKVEFEASIEVTLESVNKAALQSRYDELKDVAQGNYTQQSYNAFTAALDDALEVLGDGQAEQADVDAALAALNSAYGALSLDGKAALQTRYNQLKDTQKGSYTGVTFNAFTKALDDAKAVLDAENPTETEITGALNALNQAYEALSEERGCGGAAAAGAGALMLTFAALGLALKKKNSR